MPEPAGFTLRRLALDDMEQAAIVHRAAFDERLPWLAGLHTADEDRQYFRERVFATCDVWGASANHSLVGILAFRKGWIDQLYVLPVAQRGGVGSSLLDIAKSENHELWLWTFQRNAEARRFYERRGFVNVQQTDGSANEEREPDVLYRWTAPE